jgi:class 3 adenylate cyclase/predicted ATPase
MKCLSCGFENPDGFAFCGKCGSQLTLSETLSMLITEKDLARLKPYLPQHRWDALPPPHLWQKKDQEHTREHLNRLLDVVITYLPRHLVQIELAPGDVPPVGGAFLDGALLFADISGFTAMSEQLSTLGKGGAEQITELVSQYFGAMLEVIFAYGGDLFKFGGDALLAFFPDDVGGSASGLQAAWAMQEAMTAFHQVETQLGTFPLQMKIALHAGPVFTARVGSAEEREFIVTGPTVNATAKAEGLASAGQILISPTVRNQVFQEEPDFLTAVEGPSGHYLVKNIHSHAHPLPPPPAPRKPNDTLRQTLDALERLTPYLPPGLLPRLAPDPTRHEASGEHRLVTVLFANFEGASELIARLGRERADEIAQALNQYFTTMQQAVSRYGGVINKVDLYDHGDKLMALFGAPVARENDAERAVRAALEMQAVAEKPGSSEKPQFLHGQRIGVSSGLVFAGHVGAASRREYTVMGDEVNLAARLMSAAADWELLLSSYVQRKVSPFFEMADWGVVKLKGKSNPVPIYTIVGRRAQPEPVRGIRGLRSSLVGRDDEEAALRQSVAELCEGRGSILSLIGEAGLGKSRLVAELRARIIAEFLPSSPSKLGEGGRIVWLEGRCLSYTQQVSYSAFTDVIDSALGIVETDTKLDVRFKLQRRLSELLSDEVREDILPYLAHFLNLPLSDLEAERVEYLEGEALQRQTLRAVAVFLEHLAREHPLALAFDDLHWADSASLALLERCLALTDRVPLLILLIYRPERDHGCWSLGQTAARDYPHRYREIILTPLDSDAGQDEQLVRNLLALEKLPPSLAKLAHRAEGNPFYVEEIIRMLIDQQAVTRDNDHWQLVREIDLETVPDTLQGLLMARMDRLVEEARRTLQLASVIGRIFRRRMLAWLASAAALVAQLDASLATLQQTELVRERARLPEPEYGFKQVLIRDVAYESLLIRDRRLYHRLVGEQMERRYTDQEREEVYELLAHHYSFSDDQEKALAYLIKAGDKTRAAYANPEAIAFYRQAEPLAEELDRPQDKAAVAEGLGDVLFHIGEYDEAQASYERALGYRTEARQQADLHRRIGMVHEKRGEYEAALAACARGIERLSPDGAETVEMARLLTVRCRIYWQQGQFETALTDGKQSLALVKDTTYYREIAQAYKELGTAYYRYSQPADAIIQFEQALAIMERIGDEHGAASVYGNLAILYYQTDLNRSAVYFGRTLETMQRLGDVWGEATALQNLGVIHYARGDYTQAVDYYRRSLEMKERLGDSLGIADCHINLGETYRAQGDPTQAIIHLEKGLIIAQEIGASQAEAECHRQLAECYLEIDEPEEALAACREALEYAKEIGDRKEEGIIHRVMGNAYIQGDDPTSALAHLEQGVAILRELNQEFDLGTALYDYARALVQMGQITLAREQLSEALVLFERLALSQERDRVQSALDQLV